MIFRIPKGGHSREPPVLDVLEWLEYREIGLHLRLEAIEHARRELVVLTCFAGLRHPEAERYADDDEESLHEPMSKRAANFRHMRVHFHSRILPNRAWP